MTAAVLVGTMRFKDGQMRYWRYLLLPWVVVDCCSPHHRAAACDPARICCCPPASRCRLGAEQIKLIPTERISKKDSLAEMESHGAELILATGSA